MSATSPIRLPAKSGVRYCSIYALVDPRQPKLWRYIGRSFHPTSRRIQHARGGARMAQGATYKELWIGELLANDLRPNMLILEDCTSLSHAIVREKIWIRQALTDGHPLTNSVLSRRFNRETVAVDEQGSESGYDGRRI